MKKMIKKAQTNREKVRQEVGVGVAIDYHDLGIAKQRLRKSLKDWTMDMGMNLPDDEHERELQDDQEDRFLVPLSSAANGATSIGEGSEQAKQTSPTEEGNKVADSESQGAKVFNTSDAKVECISQSLLDCKDRPSRTSGLCRNPIDLSDRLAIRFRKIPLDGVGRETPEDDDRDDRGWDGDMKDAVVREITRQERRRQREPKNLAPFTGVLGEGGVFVLGAPPFRIMGKEKGTLRVHPMSCDGRIGCFTKFHNLNCKHGFIRLNADGNVRIKRSSMDWKTVAGRSECSHQSSCELCLQNPEFSVLALDYMVDMFMDKIDCAPERTDKAIQDRQQVPYIPLLTWSSSKSLGVSVRMPIVMVTTMATTDGMTSSLASNESNVKRFPEDQLLIYQCIRAVARRGGTSVAAPAAPAVPHNSRGQLIFLTMRQRRERQQQQELDILDQQQQQQLQEDGDQEVPQQ
ncbi:MAG: hypothetical protein J3Q66DRAFT_414959 [Benniella sp.]|nr:MAG: hypothetical protein J3Q66DRAFT_414959 [Benniella sp.]